MLLHKMKICLSDVPSRFATCSNIFKVIWIILTQYVQWRCAGNSGVFLTVTSPVIFKAF